MIFPSYELAKRFIEELNSNKEYAEASKEWEGSFLFVVNPGPRLDEEFVLFLDLWHGTCRGFAILPGRDSKKTDFIYEGTLENWGKLVKGEVD